MANATMDRKTIPALREGAPGFVGAQRKNGRSGGDDAEAAGAMVRSGDRRHAAVFAAEERVRQEIASHLHGRVQNKLLALRAHIDLIARGDNLSPETASSLSQLSATMGQVIQGEIAALSRRLYPSIARRGLAPALQSLCDQFDNLLDLEACIDPALASSECSAVSEDVKMAAYRIAEQALGNALKHAPGSRVKLELRFTTAGVLELCVCDDGPGFDARRLAEGLGLLAMRDYAETAGGTCSIESAPGRGTSVRAHLPLTTKTQARSN